MQHEKDKYTTYRKFRSKEQLDNGEWRFDTKGAVTACCEVNTTERRVKVGFSFLNPTDSQFLVRGRGLAKQKLMKEPITIEGIGTTKDGKLKITESVLEYLKAKAITDMTSLTLALGVKPYRGNPEKSEFLKWFPRLIQTL